MNDTPSHDLDQLHAGAEDALCLLQERVQADVQELTVLETNLYDALEDLARAELRVRRARWLLAHDRRENRSHDQGVLHLLEHNQHLCGWTERLKRLLRLENHAA